MIRGDEPGVKRRIVRLGCNHNGVMYVEEPRCSCTVKGFGRNCREVLQGRLVGGLCCGAWWSLAKGRIDWDCSTEFGRRSDNGEFSAVKVGSWWLEFVAWIVG